MNVLVTKSKDGTLVVAVTVDPVGIKGHEEFVDTKIIKRYLDEKKYKYGNCLQSAVVSNTSKKLMGEWVFEDLSRKTKKTVDKPEKPVLSSTKQKKTVTKDKETSE